MSVFQLNEWWSVQMSDDEEFDRGCMVIGNIDNSNPATGKRVIFANILNQLFINYDHCRKNIGRIP